MARFSLPVGEWTEVVSSAPSTLIEIQNVGSGPIRFKVAASAPTIEDDGQIFPGGQGHQVKDGLNKAYARPLNFEVGVIDVRTA